MDGCNYKLMDHNCFDFCREFAIVCNAPNRTAVNKANKILNAGNKFGVGSLIGFVGGGLLQVSGS